MHKWIKNFTLLKINTYRVIQGKIGSLFNGTPLFQTLLPLSSLGVLASPPLAPITPQMVDSKLSEAKAKDLNPLVGNICKTKNAKTGT